MKTKTLKTSIYLWSTLIAIALEGFLEIDALGKPFDHVLTPGLVLGNLAYLAAFAYVAYRAGQESRP